LLNRKRRPTAIFAANDDMAAGVIRVADRMGIDVPGELSIAGCDDIALAQQIYPALTTINQPLTSMADHAVTALVGSLQNKETLKGTDIVPAALKVRESTGPAPD
jgi:LacI family transcriptional regulator